MAGRGFLLNYIKKKDDESSNASSTSLSVTSSTPFIITGRGSGRGLTLPNLFPQSHLNYAASTSSAGTGRSITAGRGMFAVRVVPTSIMTQSSVASESSSKLVDSGADTILKDNSVQSKLIVGRGIATSGRGTVSGPGSSSKIESYSFIFFLIFLNRQVFCKQFQFLRAQLNLLEL